MGYELQGTLLLSDRDGQPLSMVVGNLRTADGLWSGYRDFRTEAPSHLDELTERIRWLEQRDWEKPLVHIVDREGEAVGHWRRWQESLWLVRAKRNSTVRFGGQRCRLSEVAESLSYQKTRQVRFKGRRAWQWLGPVEVLVDRPAKPQKTRDGQRLKPIPGEPLSLRLVVSRILNDQGQ